jgi:hypothetical protein
MSLPQYRPLTVRQSSTRGTATAPQGHNMSAQGKQPRAPRQATPPVFGSPHARPRLRSPGLRIAHSAPSPERAQQMADQINADWQTGSIGDQNECGTTSHRVVGRASCSASGTAASVRGDCCALSGLLEIFILVTQGDVSARKTRGHLPWAVMLRPLRGEAPWRGVLRWDHTALQGHDRETESQEFLTALPNGAALANASKSPFGNRSHLGKGISRRGAENAETRG